MSSTTTEAAVPATPVDPTESWKRENWQRLGWSPDDAVQLAGTPGLDWHDVESLMDRGCERTLALEIVR